MIQKLWNVAWLYREKEGRNKSQSKCMKEKQMGQEEGQSLQIIIEVDEISKKKKKKTGGKFGEEAYKIEWVWWKQEWFAM